MSDDVCTFADCGHHAGQHRRDVSGWHRECLLPECRCTHFWTPQDLVTVKVIRKVSQP